jgi:hypothetical protein
MVADVSKQLQESCSYERPPKRIAEACAVSDPFVMKVRNEVITVITSTPTTRIGRDGKQYPAKRESRGWTAPGVGQ